MGLGDTIFFAEGSVKERFGESRPAVDRPTARGYVMPNKPECEGTGMAGESAFLTNMATPMPLGRKVLLVLRNNWLKLYRRRNCCGHLGEPGC